MSDFDLPFQRGVLRLLMVEDEFAHKAIELVDSSFFTNHSLGWIFTTMKRYYATYSMRCTELPLRDALRYATPEQVPLFSAEIDAVCALGSVAEEAYIKQELREFCRRAVFSQAHRVTANLYNEGKHVQAYDEMRKAQERIDLITFEKDERSWFFDTFDVRQKARMMKMLSPEAHAFPTGILELDRATEGGIHRGEVWMVLAYAKVGKTTWLCNQGFNALRVNREPVIHFQLEGKREQTEAKYDSLFSGELYANVRRGEISPALLRELQAEYFRMRRHLVIRCWNDWDVNILKFDAELQALKAQGFVPSVAIVDYLDLMRSRHKKDSETAHQIDAARDLKSFAQKHDIALHTAAQAQRPKENADENEHVVKSAMIADAYAKVRVCDFVGSLNATREEREQNKMRFFAELHRDNQMGRLYSLTNDLDRMKLSVTSEVKSTRVPRAVPTEEESAPSTPYGRAKKGRPHGK